MPVCAFLASALSRQDGLLPERFSRGGPVAVGRSDESVRSCGGWRTGAERSGMREPEDRAALFACNFASTSASRCLCRAAFSSRSLRTSLALNRINHGKLGNYLRSSSLLAFASACSRFFSSSAAARSASSLAIRSSSCLARLSASSSSRCSRAFFS